jgi:hypothetical protein
LKTKTDVLLAVIIIAAISLISVLFIYQSTPTSLEENEQKIIQTVLSKPEIKKMIEGKDYIIFQVRHKGVYCNNCICPEEGCALVGFSTEKFQHLGVTMSVILNPITGEIFDITTSPAWDQD